MGSDLDADDIMRLYSAALQDTWPTERFDADDAVAVCAALAEAHARIRGLEARIAAMESVLQSLHDGCPEARAHLEAAGIAQDAGQGG